MAERLRLCIQDIVLHHPEVKAVAASVAWQGDLNDANINHGVWLGVDGPVLTPDGIFGSIQQTLKMLGEQFGRADQLVGHYQDRGQLLGQELVAKHEELETLQAQIEAKRQELKALYGESDGGAPV